MYKGVDFVVKAKSNKDFKILQISDPQILDASQARYEGRLEYSNYLSDQEIYDRCFYYVEQAIKQVDPDLITIAGDVIYGEFDDSGKSLERFIAFMESQNILWAPVFGNHDNESFKGATWQCKKFEQAKNCLFKKGDTKGNGNYTVGIEQDGTLKRVLFMMDSGGAYNAYNYCYMPSIGRYNEKETVREQNGFFDEQVEWMENRVKEIDNCLGFCVPKFLTTHIPIKQFAIATLEAGYVTDAIWIDDVEHVKLEPNGDGDFGEKHEYLEYFVNERVWQIIKNYNFNGTFCGHSHKNSLSLVYQGIRFSYGLKSSTFDNYYEHLLGGTQITLSSKNDDFKVEHKYVEHRAWKHYLKGDDA